MSLLSNHFPDVLDELNGKGAADGPLEEAEQEQHEAPDEAQKPSTR